MSSQPIFYQGRRYSVGRWLFLFFVIAGLGAAGFWQWRQIGLKETAPLLAPSSAVKAYGDVYLDFWSEVYDKIKENYWEKTSDEKLSNLFKLGLEKLEPGSPQPDLKDKTAVAEALRNQLAQKDAPAKKELIVKLTDLVMVNLQPFGRSRLYGAKEEKELSDRVKNIDPATDLYAVLGVNKEAAAEEIDQSYQKQSAALSQDPSPEAKEKLAQINRAYEALGSKEKKEIYDQKGIEPTVIYRLLTPDIFYLKLVKFSPPSFEEMQKAANSIDPEKKDGPTSLIFDLRGNVGGAIDILQYFLGPFIGPNNYAYDFFHQDETEPFKTKVGWLNSLVRYKKVVILIDDQAQSSAEVMAAALKKYNVGILVGTSTKGHGTVEKIVALDRSLDPAEKYSLFIVHSLTLREDGQPIEGRGVEPQVNTKDPDWPQQLNQYFNYPGLISEVKKLMNR